MEWARRALGTKYGAAYVILDQAEAAVGAGNLEEAKTRAEQSLALFREICDRRCVAQALMYLGDIAREQRDLQQADTWYEESLSLNWKLNARPGICQCFERMARLAFTQGQFARAAQMHGAATALRATMHSAMTPADGSGYDRDLAEVCRQMGDVNFATSIAESSAMTLEQAVAYALSGEGPSIPSGLGSAPP